MLRSHRVRDAQDCLKRCPAAGRANETAVLHLRPGRERIPVGLGRTEPPVAEKASQQRSVTEQSHAVRQRIRRELGGEARVEQRSTHLITRNANAAGDRYAQVGGVHVRESDCPDASGITLGFQVPQRVEPARVGECPRMKLQDIDAIGAQPRAGTIDRRAHVMAGDRSRLRYPLGEALHRGIRTHLLREYSRDFFGRPIVIGHVEGGEPVLHILGHGMRRRVAIKHAAIALHISQLPEAGQHAGDLETGCQRNAGDCRHERSNRVFREWARTPGSRRSHVFHEVITTISTLRDRHERRGRRPRCHSTGARRSVDRTVA